MKKILVILGIITILVGVLSGIYFGLYILLYGGLMQIVNSVEPLQTKELVIGILKVFFCELGAIPIQLGFMIGRILITISE